MADPIDPEMTKEFEDVYEYFDKQTNEEEKDESGGDNDDGTATGRGLGDGATVESAVSVKQNSMAAKELNWAERLLKSEFDGDSLSDLAPDLQKIFANLNLSESEGKQITDMLSSNDENDLNAFLDSLDGDDNFIDAADTDGDSMLNSLKSLMNKVLGKETLYPVLKSTTEVYPNWLKTNKNKYSAEEMASYEQQYRKLLEVCSEFENFNERTASEVDKSAHSERIYMLMEDVRKLGDPPSDLLKPATDIEKSCKIM